MITDLDALSSGLNASKFFSQQVAAAALKALQELDAEKMNRVEPLAVTISASSWIESDNVNFHYYCDIAAQEVTTNDFAIVMIDPGNTIQDSGFYSFCETSSGVVRVRAAEAPTTNLSATIWILKGAQ